MAAPGDPDRIRSLVHTRGRRGRNPVLNVKDHVGRNRVPSVSRNLCLALVAVNRNLCLALVALTPSLAAPGKRKRSQITVTALELVHMRSHRAETRS